jgi:hypothetical protein
VQHHLRWFEHIQQKSLEAPVRSRVISQTGNGKRQRKNKLDTGVCDERFEGLEYHQGVSNSYKTV